MLERQGVRGYMWEQEDWNGFTCVSDSASEAYDKRCVGRYLRDEQTESEEIIPQLFRVDVTGRVCYSGHGILQWAGEREGGRREMEGGGRGERGTVRGWV